MIEELDARIIPLLPGEPQPAWLVPSAPADGGTSIPGAGLVLGVPRSWIKESPQRDVTSWCPPGQGAISVTVVSDPAPRAGVIEQSSVLEQRLLLDGDQVRRSMVQWPGSPRGIAVEWLTATGEQWVQLFLTRPSGGLANIVATAPSPDFARHSLRDIVRTATIVA